MAPKKEKKAKAKQAKKEKTEAKEAIKKKEEMDKLYGIDTSQVNGTITIEARSGMTMKIAGREVPSPVNFRVLEVTGNLPKSVGVLNNILIGAARSILNTQVEVVNDKTNKHEVSVKE